MTWTEHIQLLHLRIDIPYIYYPPPTKIICLLNSSKIRKYFCIF